MECIDVAYGAASPLEYLHTVGVVDPRISAVAWASATRPVIAYQCCTGY